jgi:beta-galactosidase/beta-glucuronidase
MRPVLVVLASAVLWGAEGIPRPEHPQPQFQRAAWQSLNGRWEFEFDDANTGLEENWATTARKFGRSIVVPYCFESKLSGIGDPSFHPWIWYRRAFTVPAEWNGRRILLNFGAVDYRARVWVNGQAAGDHEGGHVPFGFDITPLVKPGPNTVTVRAEDPPTDRYIPRGKQYWEPQSRGIFYTRTSGIWQPVWLEAAGASHLKSLRIHPSNDGVARFEVMIARPAGDLTLHLAIRDRKEVVAEAQARAPGERAAVAAMVREPRLWSPGSPSLYDVTLELRRGTTVVDRVESYFGFRTVSVDGGRVSLNGRPVYLKFVLDQGYWPDSNLTPPTDEAIQYDIRMTKEMGFNGARKHQKLEDPRFLYWADRLGFLVSSEMANAYLYDEDYAVRFAREWMETLRRDWNHPSIIIWNPINESWGVPNLAEPRQQQHLRSLYTLTKSLDPSRLVIDNEGWEHTEMTDLFAVHDYARDEQALGPRWADFGKPGVALPGRGRHWLVPGAAYNGTPLYLSEFGGIAYIPEGHKVPESAWGYSGVEKTAEAALERLRGLYRAIARAPFAGVCYTQITDVEQEINGLMTYDRKLKFDPKVLREINSLLQ